MPATKGERAQVGNAPVEPRASVREVSVVENSNLRSAEHLDGGDVVPEVAGQPRQAVARANTEVIAPEGSRRIKAGSAARVRAIIPRRIPALRSRTIHPRVVSRRRPRAGRWIVLCNRGYSEHQDQSCCQSFHAFLPYTNTLLARFYLDNRMPVRRLASKAWTKGRSIFLPFNLTRAPSSLLSLPCSC